MNMKKLVFGMSVGFMALVGSQFVVAQNIETNSSSQGYTQEQTQQQKEMAIQSILPGAEKQIRRIGKENGVTLKEKQIEKLSYAMASFMVDQQRAKSEEEAKEMAKEYDEKVNSILTDKQIESLS